jgi:hypothetical protein
MKKAETGPHTENADRKLDQERIPEALLPCVVKLVIGEQPPGRSSQKPVPESKKKNIECF